MKIKIISSLKRRIIIVDGLPIDANRFKIFNDENPYISYFVGHETFREYGIPEGNWEFLSELKYLTEEQCRKLVEIGSYANTYFNYITKCTHKSNQKSTAKESFLSLLESEGVLFKNPLGDYEFAHKRHIVSGAWKETEENVFSPNTLIFIQS